MNSDANNSKGVALNGNKNKTEDLNLKLSQLGITTSDFAQLTTIARSSLLSSIGRKPSMSDVPREEDKNENVVKERTKELADSYLDILFTIGENPFRQGLLKTPERAAKALLHFTKGYEERISGINSKK